jgi:hypothetical protein
MRQRRQKMLNDQKDFLEVLKHNVSMFTEREKVIRAGDMYCPKCGEPRRMDIKLLYLPGPRGTAPSYLARNGRASDRIIPSLYNLACVQCDAKFTALLYPGPSGPDLAMFPGVLGGISTPHTPEGVAFYLDQAYRAESVGARSAAMAMYRGALEHLLFQQGYKTGMLKAKIDQLLKDIRDETAPKWAFGVETDFLDVLKKLGDGAVHPNDGDVKRQEALDIDLLADVKKTFLLLLFVIYEVEHKKSETLANLRAKAQILKK